MFGCVWRGWSYSTDGAIIGNLDQISPEVQGIIVVAERANGITYSYTRIPMGDSREAGIITVPPVGGTGSAVRMAILQLPSRTRNRWYLSWPLPSVSTTEASRQWAEVGWRIRVYEWV